MNPNNSNPDYLLKLPTHRLLKVYRKIRDENRYYDNVPNDRQGLEDSLKHELDLREHLNRG